MNEENCVLVYITHTHMVKKQEQNHIAWYIHNVLNGQY